MLKRAVHRALNRLGYEIKRVPRRASPGRGEYVWPHYLGDLSIAVAPENPLEVLAAENGVYDPEVARHVVAFVRAGDVAIDGGANVGLVTLQMAKAVGQGGRVYAVEPGETYCARIQRNLDLNPRFAGVVKIVRVGLSDSEGTLRWAPDPNAPYNAGFLPASAPARGEALPTRVTTLDNFVRAENLARLDFVKLDLEGMELMALQGARETLRRLRPAVFFESMEIFRNANGVADVFSRIRALLEEEGYGLYYLTPDNVLIDVFTRRMPSNTLALHRDDRRLSQFTARAASDSASPESGGR